MRQFFPLTKDGQEVAVSFINYRPRIRQEHALAREEVRKVIARNHGFDWQNEDAFEDWDTIKNAETVGKIFDVMDLFLGGVGLVTVSYTHLSSLLPLASCAAEFVPDIPDKPPKPQCRPLSKR